MELWCTQQTWPRDCDPTSDTTLDLVHSVARYTEFFSHRF